MSAETPTCPPQSGLPQSGAGQSAIQPGVAPREIEQLFQVALFLLIVTGFGALAATGKLDPFSLLLVFSALAVRGVFLFRERPLVIPRRATSWLAAAYLPLFLADFFFFSGRDFVTPSVHLVLFGACIKLFNVERDRDYVYLAVLAFLMVLSAAILTVDSAFLATFAVFLVIAVFWFMAAELRRAARRATNTAPLIIPGLLKRRRSITPLERLSASLIWTTLAMVAAIAALGTVLFFGMPRVNGGYLSRRAQSDAISTGFSDSVNLGAIGHIEQSHEVVAHVRILGDDTGTRVLRLRGAVLSDFDGRRWSNPRRETAIVSQSFGQVFQLQAPGSPLAKRAELRLARGPRRNPVRYRILMEPLNTPVIFTIPSAQALFGPFREIAVDDDDTFHNLDNNHAVTLYEGVSDVSVPLPTSLAKLPDEAAPPAFNRYLKLPGRLDPRIAELAREITSSQPNPYLRAAAIERYLPAHYGYTLQLPSTPPPDPIADFLFHRRRGHCEYFASSMAVMLRTLGIPSRIVTGFRGAQFNQVNDTYIVRASDAHSWVEAFIPGAGWITFDPTPAGDAAPAGMWNRSQLYLDAAREFWQEWIVKYDAQHQQALSIAAIRQTRSSASEVRLWARQRYHQMLELARRLHSAATRNPRRLLHGGVLLLVLLLLPAVPFAAIGLRNALRKRSPHLSPRSASSIFYLRLTRRLARRGYRRAASQTASEFAASIGDPDLRQAVERFTAAYERARFGDCAQDAASLPVLLQQLGKPSGRQ